MAEAQLVWVKRLTLVELLEALELRSETALGGSVDNEDDLALELAQIKSLTSLCSIVSILSSSVACRISMTYCREA